MLNQYATAYIDRGWGLIKLKPNDKIPIAKEWQKNPIRDIAQFNGHAGNLGVQLGRASDGLMDADLDCQEAIDLAPQYLPHTPAKFGRASKPRSHWLYQVKGETPAKKFYDHNMKVIVELRGDHSTGYGGQTAFPPSIHPTGELYEWDTPADEPAVVTYDVLRAAIEQLVQAVRVARGGPATPEPEPVRERTEKASLSPVVVDPHSITAAALGGLRTGMAPPDGVAEGSRDEQLFLWASSCLGRGMSVEEALTSCYERNDTFNPPLDDNVVVEKVKSAWKYEEKKRASQPVPPHSLPFHAPSNPPVPGILSELRWCGEDTEADPPRWLIKDLLPQSGTGLLSGQWGMAKTYIALDLAFAVARNAPVANYKCKHPGGVLYLAAEGSSQIPIRLKALQQKYHLDRRPVPFAWLPYCPPFVPGQGQFGLMEFAKAAADEMQNKHKVPLVLIIIDTLAAAAGFKDENNASEVQGTMNFLNAVSTATRALVLAVDHFGKMVETGTRGTSAKEASADAVIACLGDRSQAGVLSNTRITVRKLRAGRTGGETGFSLAEVDMGKDEDGDRITTCTVDWSPVTVKADAPRTEGDKWSSTARKIRRALIAILQLRGTEQRPFPDQPAVRAVELEKVRCEFNVQNPAEGKKEMDARKHRFKRGCEAAREDGVAQYRDINGTVFIWLTSDNRDTMGTIGTPL